NDLHQSSRREPVHGYLPAEAAGHERVELVLLAGGDIDARRGVAANGVVERRCGRLAREQHAADKRRTRDAEHDPADGMAHRDLVVLLEKIDWPVARVVERKKASTL